jgi:chromosome segregation protein
LLKLKRVEIQGFKSFYDRTEMKFQGNGIAAVVGPNGCGKSNLSDAISWVLGEQSAKSLRGARMEDVIFAGTRDKKPLGMATVTMTLVPDQAILVAAANAALPPSPENTESLSATNGTGPSQNGHRPAHDVDRPAEAEVSKTAEKLGEVTITRRLYRSGESEYLINGKLARLRDIQDLFLGTGLGPESYAIIEQGRIGQILSNKPSDRRALIEEAAGITKFKTRKRLAEAKLESAKQNLARVFDILEEVTRQVNSLKRQAAKTKRYGELRTEATGYLRQVLAVEFQIQEREAAKLTIELNLASKELDSVQAAIAERETEQTKAMENSYITEQELTEARKQLADLQLEAERARAQLEYQTKQVHQIEQRLSSGEEEGLRLEKQQVEREAEVEQQIAELNGLEQELGEAQHGLEEKAAERQQAQNRLAEQERGLEGKRQKVLRLLGDSSSLKNRITQIEAQIATAERDGTRARNEEEQASADRARLQKTKDELSERLAARQTELISVADQRKAVEEELQVTKTKLQESRHTLDRLRSEHSRVKARKDSLEEILEHRSYTTETVKRLFTAVGQGKVHDFHPVGVLADFLDVDARFEKATEEFLHDELEYVVVRNWEHAERGVQLMRGDLEGRATFLVEGEERSAIEATGELPRPVAEPEKLSPLSETLRLTNGLATLPLQLLPRIANCYVTYERALARELAAQFPHCWFLTPDGANYHGCAVSGGKKSGSGPLALKRELRELVEIEHAKQREQTEAQAQLLQHERSLATLTEQLEALRHQQQSQEKDVLALDHESRKLAEELQRVHGRLSHARLELERLGRDRVKLEESLASDRQALETLEEQRRLEEEALEAARDELSGSREEVARVSEEHATVRANLASLEERRRSLAAHRTRLENQVRDLSNRREHLAHEIAGLIEERKRLLASNAELESRSGEVKTFAAEVEGKVVVLAEREAGLRAQLAAAEEELKRLRNDARAMQERRSEVQVSLARNESDLKHLEETCLKELEMTLEQLAGALEAVPEEISLEELESTYNEVRRKIEALGPINSQALEEYEEAQQRQDFLNAQRQDLLDSIRDTERAIHEIDTESRKRFSEAFQAINAHFREMFNILFSGGTGEMRLTDEENLAESGIDIVASPPGKRLQSVLLLSGGEKSLTAMALLMAIFQYTPSPFCILDEVDAPLDEANIERLTRLLREMSERTQFIVITHAKRTMEAAGALYGVTMQEPGVSKLVSVRFKQDDNGRARAAAVAGLEEAFEPALA